MWGQDVIPEIFVLAVASSVSANWCMALSIAAESTGIIKSTAIASSRRHPLDRDSLIVGLLAAIGFGAAILVHLFLPPALADWKWKLILVPASLLGLFIPLFYSRYLARFYLSRAKDLFENEALDEALEDASEVIRRDGPIKQDGVHLKVVCLVRKGELDLARATLLDHGTPPNGVDALIRSHMILFPPIQESRNSVETTSESQSEAARMATIGLSTPRPAYRMSGRIDFVRTLLFSAIGCVVAMVVCIASCYLTCSLVSARIGLLCTVLIGACLGGITTVVSRLGHVRNRWFGFIFPVILAVFGWYAGWAMHHYYFTMIDPVVPGIRWSIPTPLVLMQWGTLVFQNGIWMQAGGALKGWPLLVIWGSELIAWIVIAVPLARLKESKKRYCEQCRCWMRPVDRIIPLPAHSNDPAIQRVAEGDLSGLLRINVEQKPSEEIGLQIYACPKCTGNRTLEINKTVRSVVENKPMVDVKRLAGPLLISGQEEQELMVLADQLQAISMEVHQVMNAPPSRAL